MEPRMFPERDKYLEQAEMTDSILVLIEADSYTEIMQYLREVIDLSDSRFVIGVVSKDQHWASAQASFFPTGEAIFLNGGEVFRAYSLESIKYLLDEKFKLDIIRIKKSNLLGLRRRRAKVS